MPVSTTAEKKTFLVTVKGQYLSVQEGAGVPLPKGYEETFSLPSQEAALSTICKHLLASRLRKRHADYIRFRTHELVGITLVGYTPNREVLQMGIDEMDLKDLSDFCILRQILIDPFKHGDKDIFAIRAMVQKVYTEKRQALKDEATSKQGADNKEADFLRRMNDLEPTSKDPVIDINALKQTKAAQAHAQASGTAIAATPAAQAPLEADEPLPEPEDDPILE